jgi:hypothetical protein
LKHRSLPKNCVAVEQDKKTAGLTTPRSPIIDRNLIKAVRITLQAVCARRESPAWAVLNIYYETSRHDDDDESWAGRFLHMTSKDYSIKWDVSMDAWSGNGSISFSGYEIAQQCRRWIEKGWDFNTHDCDEDPCTQDVENLHYDWAGGETCISREESSDDFFPLPLAGEIVRRVWAQEQSGSTVLRYLDIRCASATHCQLYEYVIQEEGNPMPISSSGGFLECLVLKVLVQAEALPITASPPYFVDASRWLDEAKKASLKRYRPDHDPGLLMTS